MDKKILETLGPSSMVIPVNVSDFPVIPPPEAGSEIEEADLKAVMAQMNAPVTSPSLSHIYDVSFLDLYNVYLDSKGITFNESYYQQLFDSCIPLIMKKKAIYARQRPEQTAARYGIKLPVYRTETSSSPSYPSGHAMLAYMFGNLLKFQFPEHEYDIMNISELICQSRIDHGLHFNSDIIFGRMLGKQIADKILESQYPED